MTMTDPIADMLTHMRNALQRGYAEVTMPGSKLKSAIAGLLREEGYIDDFSEADAPHGGTRLTIKLRYYQGAPVISELKRVSRPGLRIYRGAAEIPKVNGGLGVCVVSTPKGLMSDRAARAAGIGGELLFRVA